MAIAPQNIMSKLRSMQDQELAKYAAMHKDDPYIFPLAFQESQNRKHVRAAEQAKAAGQEQPKVVDQDLQEMAPEMQALPEDVGIAQLPAQNMQGMAGGGIVAFEEGGHVPRYQGMTDGSLVQTPGGLGIYSQGSFGPQAGDAELTARIARIEANPRMSRSDKDSLIAQARQEFGLPKITTIPPTTPVPMGAKPTATPTVAPAAAPDTKGTSPLINKEKSVVDKAIERKQVEDVAEAEGRKLPPEPGLPSIDAYMKKYEAAVNKNAPTKDGLMKEFEAIDKPLVEKIQAGIDKESSRLKTDKEQDFYMSLIQGGLAAAAESGPNALQNIAKGFSVGAGTYKEALKDFRKATQENSKMEMELAKYQASGKKDALKSYYDAQARRDDRYAQGMSALMTQQMQTQGQMAIASQPGAQERLFKSLSDPTSATAKGLKTYAETMGPEAKGDTALRTAAVNKWSSEPMLRQEFNNDFDAYYRMMAGQRVASGATSNQLAALKKYGVSVPGN